MQPARKSHPSPVPSPLVRAPDPYLPRFDFYGPVHKGLRWALSTVLERLGGCSPTDPSIVQVALDDLEGALYLFAYHAAHEDRHVHKALEARRAGSSALFAAAHEKQESMIAELRGLAAELTAAPAAEATAILRSLYLQFARFAAENLEHMTEEEDEGHRLLEALYARDEIERLSAEVRAEIGPDETRAFLRVMALGTTRHERALILQRAQLTLPPDVFETLLVSVRAELPESDLRDLNARLAT